MSDKPEKTMNERILEDAASSREQFYKTHAEVMRDIAATPDRASRERGNPPCALCCGPHPFDTVVPSVVWNRVVRAQQLPDYLCLTCIVRAFVLAGESFTAELIGDAVPQAVVEVRINSQPAKDAVRVGEQNTELRAALISCEAVLSAAYADREKPAAFDQLSGAELGRMWLATTEQARAAIKRATT